MVTASQTLLPNITSIHVTDWRILTAIFQNLVGVLPRNVEVSIILKTDLFWSGIVKRHVCNVMIKCLQTSGHTVYLFLITHGVRFLLFFFCIYLALSF